MKRGSTTDRVLLVHMRECIERINEYTNFDQDRFAERGFVIVTRADNVGSASTRLLVEHLRDVAAVRDAAGQPGHSGLPCADSR